MSVTKTSATLDHLASRIALEHSSLAQRWLERLDRLLTVPATDVFPSHQLLDHIPELILEISHSVRAPHGQEIAANTAVMAKASELGALRFDQRATVHQLLREYQILHEILEEFVGEETAWLGPAADACAAVRAVSRTSQAVRVLQQHTVDAFVTRFTETIERQTSQLRDFSRLVSHEIRQPLGVLQVLSRVIPVAPGEPEAPRLMQTLERNVVRLADVAGKLERLARLTRRADASPSEQVVDLTTLADDVGAQLADMADARGVQIVIEPGLPAFVADAGRVELVLMNLIANAVKYSDPAKPERMVWVRPGRADGRVSVTVVDNGIGIPDNKLERIFEQFVRVHEHMDDELGAQGLGLGLAIVRECMDAMNGVVRVSSREGEGTTFTLEWTRSAPMPAPKADVSAADA